MLIIYIILIFIVLTLLIFFEEFLKCFGVYISIFLLFLILFQLPREEIGLVTLPAAEIFGSPSSIQRKFRELTNFCILLYVIIALVLNVLQA